jgi:acetoin utilization protein AcuB
MLVSDVMIREVFTLAPDETLREAILKMNDHHVRHLPVVEDDVLKGILSERDIRLHAIPVGTDSEPHLLRLDDSVSDVMTMSPIVVAPDLPLNQLLDVFLEEKVGAVPVVSDGRELLGIVGYLDLLAFLRSVKEVL